jgi:oligopeptide transport system substrate-binding protein
MKKLISLLLVASLVLALAACGTGGKTTASPDVSAPVSTSPSVTPSEAASPSAPKTIKIGVSYDPTTLDPADLNLDCAYDCAFLIYDPLLQDVDGKISAGAAEKWEHNDSMTEWTFHLRQAAFSDGTAITAGDYVYAIMRIIDPAAGHANAAGLLKLINANEYYSGTAKAEDVGIAAVDNSTLKLTFANPVFESEFTSFLYSPVNEKLAESAGAAYGTAPDKVLGNGPFVMTEWVPDASVTLVKNDMYWNADSIKMSEITFLVGATGDTAVDMLQAGEVDLSYFTSANQLTALTDTGFTSSPITSSYRCLNLNLAGSSEAMNPFMSNINFRKALNMAIDRESLCATVLTTDVPAFRLTAPSELGVSKAFNDEYPYEAWSTTSDPASAKEYLQKALDELGKTIDDVPPLVLLCYESQSSVTVLSAVQDMLKQNLGLASEISSQTVQNMMAMAFGGQFDIWLGGNGTSTPDWLADFASQYTSASYAAQPGLRGYSNPEFDALYDAVAVCTDYSARKDTLFELEKYFCDNVLNLIVGWTTTHYVASPAVTGVHFRADGNPYFALLDYTA